MQSRVKTYLLGGVPIYKLGSKPGFDNHTSPGTDAQTRAFAFDQARLLHGRNLHVWQQQLEGWKGSVEQVVLAK